MSTELSNGVIIPEEYSDDWYDEMSINLRKLNDVIGSDSEKLNADGVDFLRMSSAALTDGGTGNFSDLNSSYKIKTGDLVLDSGRKLYQIVSVDSTNETFTVGNSLFKVTAESDLAPVAESGDYGDLDNRPDLNPYDQHLANTDIHVTAADKQKWNNGVSQAYVLRYSCTAITDNSTIAYSTLDNTDNIKADDKIIDVDGKIFSIVSVDSDNSTVTVGSALIDLHSSTNVVAVGSYIQFAGSQAPEGFLVCNGGEISRTTYSALFAVIGTTYGSGDGSTTFNLPNLTDRFLQGSTTVGTYKSAGLPDITGWFNYNCTGSAKDVTSTGAFDCPSGNINTRTSGDGDVPIYVGNCNFNASNSNSIYNNSATVQPPALTCLICIKY